MNMMMMMIIENWGHK